MRERWPNNPRMQRYQARLDALAKRVRLPYQVALKEQRGTAVIELWHLNCKIAVQSAPAWLDTMEVSLRERS